MIFMNTEFEIQKVEQQLELIKSYGDLNCSETTKIKEIIYELEQIRFERGGL